MDYFRITDLLGKFAKIINDSDSKKEIIISILIKHIKKPIKKEQIKIEKGFLILDSSPIMKNEVYMHKTKILADLQEFGFLIKDIK